MPKTNKRILVLVAGMLIQLCAGIIYMWSVFRAPVAAHLNWPMESASLTSSIMLAAFVAGIVAGGRVQDKIGPKKVVLAGSLLFSAGMILTSFVQPSAPALLYLTYGIVAGFGVGAVYTTTVSVVQKWFPDKRGFATGMMVSAFGFSTVIFTAVAKHLLATSGVPSTFLMIGLLFLAVCGLSSFLISNPPASAQGGAALQGKQYTTAEMLKTGRFYLIALSMLLVLPAFFFLNPQFVSLGEARGLSHDAAIQSVMLVGIANASGRLLFSWFSDLVGRKNAILTMAAVMLAAIVTMIFAQGALYLVALFALTFAFGGSAGVYPVFTADNFGTKHIGLNYGCVMVAFGIAALASPLLLTPLSKDGSFTLPLILTAAASVVSFVLVLLIPKKKAE